MRLAQNVRTFFAVVGDCFQVYEMGSDCRFVYGIVVLELDFYSLAKRRKHLEEHDLLVPDRSVAVLFHAGFTLENRPSLMDWRKTNLDPGENELTDNPAKETCT